MQPLFVQEAYPTPPEITWEKNRPFVDPIAVLVTEALMNTIETGSKISLQGNRIVVQKFSNYTFQIPWFGEINLLPIVRTTQGECSSKENLSVSQPATLLVGQWVWQEREKLEPLERRIAELSREITTIQERKIVHDDEDEQRLERLKNDQTTIDKERIPLQTRLKAIEQTLKLAQAGLDALNRTYFDKSPNTCSANDFRKIMIDKILKEGIKCESNKVVSLIEERIRQLWTTQEIELVNNAITLASTSRSEGTIRAQIKYVIDTIDTKNKEFEAILKSYWDAKRM